jgi:hypothetical protein
MGLWRVRVRIALLTLGAQVPVPPQDEDDKAAAAGSQRLMLSTLISTIHRAAAGAGGSPSAPAVTPAPPSVEAINAFSIPPLDINQDETGASGAACDSKTSFDAFGQG